MVKKFGTNGATVAVTIGVSSIDENMIMNKGRMEWPHK